MRASTLTADLVSVGFLLACLLRASALSEMRDVIVERDAHNGDAVELPDYDQYGGPPPNRGAYDYVTITYGGYGPPPPPTSSSSTLGQSASGTATSAVSNSLPSGATANASSGFSSSSLPTLGTTSALSSTVTAPLESSISYTGSAVGSNTPPVSTLLGQSTGSNSAPTLPTTGGSPTSRLSTLSGSTTSASIGGGLSSQATPVESPQTNSPGTVSLSFSVS
ncbi:hypothetical protein F5B22DRAFT_652510 [Xylaria bambusicola]|uniref:uncharacterized protein n=1 Tax=Xylaria bambusicola TaxID=326684 RepID=UPI0020089EE8|nr:uncharacterized protein F5B22DRAFT_652510 [Xylaria bambusicola]KAI0503005.1 hypothetical protein F5B22DRAFT_652510 [Xylaria bambusicola]